MVATQIKQNSEETILSMDALTFRSLKVNVLI